MATISNVPIRRFIVAELSKSWYMGESGSPMLLNEMFERCITFNRDRGYKLVTFNLAQLLTAPNEMVETIIAVFELDIVG